MTVGGAIDPQAIDIMLENTGGDPEFVAEIIGDYLDDTVIRLEELRSAVANGDATAARRAAHTVKGSSASFGASLLSSLAAQAEHLSQRSDLASIAELLPALSTELERVRIALHAEHTRLLGTGS